MNDREIIGLFLARDEQAIAQTLARYGETCRSMAMFMLGSQQDAEECVNDTMLKLWNAIPPANPEHFAAYLYTALRRTAMDRWEHQRAEKRGGSQIAAALDELNECVSAGDDVAAQLESRELTERINRFLGSLKKTDRNLFVARYYAMMPVGEIAERFGLSVSNVKVRLMRTRRALKKLLQKEAFL